MNSLKVNINDVDYTDKYCGISIGYEKIVLDATVFVDDSDLINHFNITCDSKWIDIQRIRNEITIVVSKNNSLNDRSGIIVFTHNLDSEVFIRLSICQDACKYDIVVDQDYILFDTLLDYDDPEKMDVIVNVGTLNGIRDFGIGSVAEYVRTFEFEKYNVDDIIFAGDTYYVKDGDNYIKGTSITTFPYHVQSGDDFYYYELNDAYREGETIHTGQKYWHKSENKYQILTATEDIVVPENDGVYFRITNDHSISYDHGLKLTKLDNHTLKITNYGQVCLYDDFYYILTLYHVNNPRCIAQIRIDYVDAFANNESGFDLDDDE